MPFKFNPLTSELDLVNSPTVGTGNVISTSIPSTDNAISRYDGITGLYIQDSLAILSDSGTIESRGFIGHKEIDTAISLPQKTYMVVSGLMITGTGSLFIDNDSNVIII